MSEEKINALEIENLNVEYHVDKEVVHALNGISFKLAKGKTIGLVGETGAGKTTTGLSILRLIPSPPGVVKGTIKVQGEDISTLSEKQMESIRGNVVSMIFQDPMTSLNPTKTVEAQIAEPTTALDVTIQAQVLDMIRELKRKYNMSMIMITHDLGIVAEICDTVAIVYAGHIVEYGTLEDIFNHTAHPYTVGLFGSLPNMDDRTQRLKPIPGLMPDPTKLPAGCPFCPRCPHATEKCQTVLPELIHIGGEHVVACHLFKED